MSRNRTISLRRSQMAPLHRSDPSPRVTTRPPAAWRSCTAVMILCVCRDRAQQECSARRSSNSIAKKSLIPDRLSPIGRTDRLRISTSYSIGRSRSLAIFHRSQFGVDYQEARAALWSELLRIRCEPDLMPLILGCAAQRCRGRFSALQDAASIFAALSAACGEAAGTAAPPAQTPGARALYARAQGVSLCLPTTTTSPT